MRRTIAALAALLVTLAALAGAPSARAQVEDLCTVCKASGRVGCGGCHWPFIGKCSHCSGMYAVTTPANCHVCRSDMICRGCEGKGVACLVCKGSGRLPAGTNAAIEKRRREENTAAIHAALKPLAFLATGGPWEYEGAESGGGRAYSGRLAADLRLEGTWLRERQRTTYSNGEVTETLTYVTYETANKGYFALFFESPGSVYVLRGPASEDGRKIAFSVVGSEQIRLSWTLLPGEGIDSVLEKREGTEGGQGTWATVASTRLRKAGSGAKPATGPGAPDPERERRKAAVREAMKPLSHLAGEWEVKGKEAASTFTGRMAVDFPCDGTFLCAIDAATYSDGRFQESDSMVTYELDPKAFGMVVLTAPGRSIVLKGRLEDGKRLVMGVALPGGGEDYLRLVWSLRPEGIDSVVEERAEVGWRPISSAETRRAGGAKGQ